MAATVKDMHLRLRIEPLQVIARRKFRHRVIVAFQNQHAARPGMQIGGCEALSGVEVGGQLIAADQVGFGQPRDHLGRIRFPECAVLWRIAQ